MHTVMAAISLVGSAFATLSSLYLWVVRFRGERPNLTVHLAGPVGADTLAAAADAPPGHTRSGSTARALFGVKAVVANSSTLPNAVLGVKAWVQAADGGWLPATLSLDEKTQPPFNVPPMQTTPLAFTATVVVPERPESAPKVSRRDAAREAVARPLRIGVELTGLHEKRFSVELTG